LKRVLPDAAEFIARYWSPASIEYPMGNKVKYLRYVMSAFEMLGVYEDSNSRYPVSWLGRKSG